LKITPPTNDPWISALHAVSRFFGSLPNFAFWDRELKQTEESRLGFLGLRCPLQIIAPTAEAGNVFRLPYRDGFTQDSFQ
jgi:hypothetical protein